MNRVTITTNTGASQAELIVVGHYADASLPAALEDTASLLATNAISGVHTVVSDGTTYLLGKPDAKAWLVGDEDWRILGGQFIQALRAAGKTSAKLLVDAKQSQVTALLEGILLADYRFEQCRSGTASKRSKMTIRAQGQGKAISNAVTNASAQNLAREVCDMPGNLMNPQTFITRARKEVAGLGLQLKVTQGVTALAKAGFPGLVQVGRASDTPPALLEIHYRPKKTGKSGKTTKKGPQLALVGKGITFDTGGISLKPGSGMWEMKGDMGGAAGVLAAMIMIAKRKPKTPVSAYCALAENMPDGHAQRPGDIYRARNGTYIHVDNTDAEGRLVLSDVLTYACEQGATHIADAATLTGACLVALGTNIAAVMSNDEQWSQALRQSGQEVGEELWPLPLYGEYRKLLDHPHADINNTGGRFAGTITAGLFLQEFITPGVHWAHVDIAGPAMMAHANGNWRYFSKGNTGFVARTFANLVNHL